MSCHSQRGGEERSEKAARGIGNAVDSDEYTADQEKAVKRYNRDKAVKFIDLCISEILKHVGMSFSHQPV